MQPAAYTQRHRRAIHVKVVGRDAGLWGGDESLSGRRALVAAHRHARANCTSLTKLRGKLPQSNCSTFPDDAALHGEAPCRAGHAGGLTAYIDSEAESMFQLNRCHTLRLTARSAMQFYSRGNDLAPRSKRVAQALCTGNEVQSNSQT